PEEIATNLRRLRDIAGDRLHVMFRVKYPGVPHDRVSKAISLLGQVRDLLKQPAGVSRTTCSPNGTIRPSRIVHWLTGASMRSPLAVKRIRPAAPSRSVAATASRTSALVVAPFSSAAAITLAAS